MSGFIDAESVRRVLQGLNPWWSGKPFTAPAFRRRAFGVTLRLVEDQAHRRAILLSGPRRVGKTTILLQIADWLVKHGHDPKSVLYVSLDHPLLKLSPLTAILENYHEGVYPEGKPVTLLMDEVQYAEDWELHIKALVDHRPEYRIVATGSATVVHRKQLAESGVGRWIRVPVPTLSFPEFLRIRGEPPLELPAKGNLNRLFHSKKIDFSNLADKARPYQILFNRYLLVGGFPETAKHPDMDFCQRILREDVVERVLKRDMTALFHVRNVNALERLFIYLCLHSGGIFEVQTCAKALGEVRETIANHLEILEQANLIRRLPPAQMTGKKILKARHKVYMVDAALRNAVLLRGEEILEDPAEMGLVVETTVLGHLLEHFHRDTPRVSYWRDPATNREVDMVVEKPGFSMPVEVKYRESPELGEKTGLVEFCKREKVIQAVMVTKKEADFGLQKVGDLSTVFLKIPAHLFCLILGSEE